MSTTSTSSTKRPVYRKSLPGGLSIAVFENDRDGRIQKSVNFQRSYRQGDAWVRKGMYLDHDQLPFAIEILQATLSYLNGEFGTKATMVDEPEAAPISESEPEYA